MKSTSKKIMCMLLAVVMLMTSWAFAVSAEDACAHTYSSEKEIIVTPTCKSTGLKGYVCTQCGAFDKDSTEVLGFTDHNYEFAGTTDSTCTVAGKTEYKCSVCGVTKEEALPVKAHAYSEWTVAKEPTCKEVGKNVRICADCGYHQEKVIPIKHPAEYINVVKAVEPTCEKHGTTEWSFCKLCGETIVPAKRLAPLGHKLYTVADGSVPTCTETGSGHIQCSICSDIVVDEITGKEEHVGLYQFVEIPALGHSDEDSDGFCDVCETRMCHCACHKEGFLATIYKLINDLMNKFFPMKDKEGNVIYVYRCCNCVIA